MKTWRMMIGLGTGIALILAIWTGAAVGGPSAPDAYRPPEPPATIKVPPVEKPEKELEKLFVMVLVEGVGSFRFSEVTGLGSETEVIEEAVTGPDGQQTVRKRPGRTSFQPISLKRGVTNDMGLWRWREAVEKGAGAEARKSVSIIILDREGEPVARWHLANAWPSRATVGVEAGIYIEDWSIAFDAMERAE